jgi:peptidoglycan/LPS O-acetylase OafA/YrhL
MKSSRRPELDGLRGIAVLAVIGWHYFRHAIPEEAIGGLATLRQSMALSWAGLDLFFVLSGFLIAGGLLDSKGQPGYFRQFYIRRAFRILPVYALMVAGYLILRGGTLPVWLFEPKIPTWGYLTFTQNFHSIAIGDTSGDWLSATWSLAVEEQFYLFVPLLIALVNKRAFLWVAVALVASAPATRIISNSLAQYYHPLACADSLFTGALVAMLIRSESAMAFATRHIGTIKAATVVGALLAVLVCLHPRGFVPQKTCVAAVFGAVILILSVERTGLLARSLSHRYLVGFGLISYSLYLFHLPVNALVHWFAHASVPFIRHGADVALSGMAFVISAGLAWVSYLVIERPMVRLGKRFTASRTEGPIAGVPRPRVPSR